MIKSCGNCGEEVNVEKWVECPFCGHHNHFKRNKKGRLKKHTCHPPNTRFEDPQKKEIIQDK